MNRLRTLLADSRVRLALAVAMALGAAVVWLAWRSGVDMAQLKAWWAVCNAYLRDHPAALFWGIVFLPGLPVPMSALLVTTGLVWHDRPVMACLLTMLAISLNLSWTYWMAAKPARGLVEKLMAAGSFQIPELPRGDHLKLILVLRLTPGFPFFLQNYVLGFMRAPFLLYLWVSMLCTGVIATGVVLGAVGLGGGKLRWAILGVSLIVVGGIFTHLLRGWLARRKGKVVRQCL